jgi:hypothetical protein
MMSPVWFRLGRPGMHRHGITHHSRARPVRLIDEDVRLTDSDIQRKPTGAFATQRLGQCRHSLAARA